MAKYSYEFKQKTVQAYLNGEGGYGYLAKKYNIPVKRNIEVYMISVRRCRKTSLVSYWNQLHSQKKISYEWKLDKQLLPIDS